MRVQKDGFVYDTDWIEGYGSMEQPYQQPIQQQAPPKEYSDDVKKAVKSIQSGSLTDTIRKNMKYTSTGIIVGGIAGFVLSGVLGLSKFTGTLGGAVIGGTIGYLNRKPTNQ